MSQYRRYPRTPRSRSSANSFPIPAAMTQQRGYYSDLINPDLDRQLPAVNPRQVARAKKGDSLLKKTGSLHYVPDPLTFSVPPPDEFRELLDRQTYGPSTALLGISDYAKRAWDPKVQVPFHVLSGQTPRKVEMERRRREYGRHQIASLIEEEGEDPRRLVPNATASSKPRPGSWHFPSFLPLECFDDESFDPRTPDEWMDLGLEKVESGEIVRKPIPGKALLPDLNPPPPPSRPLSSMQDESDRFSRPGSSRSLRSGAHTPLDPIPTSRSSSRHSLLSPSPAPELASKIQAPAEDREPPFYEWVEVGVLRYCSDTKRYLVKRAVVPNSLAENGLSSSSNDTENNGEGGQSSDPCSNNGNSQDNFTDSSSNGISGSLAAGANGNAKSEEVEKPRKKRKLKRVVTSVEDIGDRTSYWVPRIHLLFMAEDPRVFSQRIVQAIRDRRITEAHLRYHLYIDCMPCKEADVTLESRSLEKMSTWALDTPGLKDRDLLQECLNKLKLQAKLDHRRAMNRIIFDKTVQLHPNTFPYVCVPKQEIPPTPPTGKHPDVPQYPYQAQFQKFMFLTLMTSPEAVRAQVCVRHECNKVHEMFLFNTSPAKPLKVDEFEQLQVQQCVQVQTYLMQDWSQKIVSDILNCLRGHSKGAYNLEESQWDVYLVSKMRKLMNVVRFSMQDAIRYLIEGSLALFCEMVLISVQTLSQIDEEFVWPSDIFHSTFLPARGPIFLIDLELHDGGPAFSSELSEFARILISCFDKGIDVTQATPQLENRIMDRLFWKGNTPLLESVGAKEPPVSVQREKIRVSITHSLIPLRAYAARYEQYMPLHLLNIDQYIAEFMEEEQTAQQIKAEIDKHLSEKDVIDASIPTNIVIGPFFVNTETIRGELIKKKKKIATRLLTVLCSTLRSQCEKICDEFKEVSHKIHIRPNSPEELMEQREYLTSIPDLLQERQSTIEKSILGFNLLEEFYFALSQEDFDTRWDVVAWPSRLVDEMEQAEVALDKDDEHFRKNLVSDQNKLEDKLDELDSEISNFYSFQDISKAQDTAVRVRRIERSLKECQDNSSLFQSRERLFTLQVTQYDKLARLFREFDPYKNLWSTTAEWRSCHESWMNNSLMDINPEELEQKVTLYFKTIHKCTKTFKAVKGCLEVAEEIKSEIEKFRPFLPLIQSLRNPGMRNRHWEQLSAQLGTVIKPKPSLTFAKCLEMGLDKKIDEITKIAEIAAKEFSIEQALDKMEQEWEPQILEIKPYKSTGTFIMKAGDNIRQLLDDHIVMTQSMSFSPYKKPFELRIASWENRLRITQDVIEEWQLCQRQWLYLEPIFSSEDINQQLPVESKRYQTMERMWRKMMNSAKNNPKVVSLCPDVRLLENQRECSKLLEQVQKGLSEYLETKRSAFPRFYFLSDDELLQILSQTKDPTAVQPHLRKCFENIAKLTFEKDLRMSEMWSGDGEMVPFSEPLYPKGNVEFWMMEVERVMRNSVRDCIKRALEAYPSTPGSEWVLKWPGQVVIAGSQTCWTTEVTKALEQGSLDSYCKQLLTQLEGLVTLMRGKLTNRQSNALFSLIVIEVHARDVVENMRRVGVKDVDAFEWISQLRHYWEDDTVLRSLNAKFNYGYEYLGSTRRLVITPLTDRCYLTLTGALHLGLGGSPTGPAGTGKTETVKDLAKAMGLQCVVFNCSDLLDYKAMGKYFKGLASAGAWGCFDEFNRIDIEVLSVVAQQIKTIQKAVVEKLERFWFEGVELPLKLSCAVFVTMNPGYAGRTELPDNLKALFRPIAMMVPDYALIAEIFLFSFGFSQARILAKKIVTAFKLSSEQLSPQCHYDFGMRALKSVVSAAGNKRMEHPDLDEEIVILRAVREMNVPKFLREDLKLFNGIVSDLFPHVKDEAVDYGDLESQIRSCSLKQGLQDVDEFVAKCIQLYETTVVRHGLMLVGPTASGKTKCYEVLKAALTNLKGQMSSSGQPYEKVLTHVLNPKSITLEQLYGEFDPLTFEWTDGLLSSLVRQGVSANTPDKKWFVLDGPVDAIWIEDMNTILDDNKKLCLANGEMLSLTGEMRFVFEVQDLAVASPATVSRCGMVYLEPSLIGLSPFLRSWTQKLKKDKTLKHIHSHIPAISQLLDKFVQRSINFIRERIKEIVATSDANLVFSLLKMFECFFKPFIITEGVSILEEKLKMISDLIEPWFIFSFVWTMGATCENDGRAKLDGYVRELMKEEGFRLLFPEEGLVYDYTLDDGGASAMEKREEGTEIRWQNWMHDSRAIKIDPYMKYSDIIVPTRDTIRSNYLIELLLTNKKPVMCVGATGTGKTLCVVDKLLRTMPKEYLSHILNFSAQTSANQTQDTIESKLDKKREGVFGSLHGKQFVFFIDDFNTPAVENYGAQPPMELLRQWMDHRGWYDRKVTGAFKNIEDMNFISAMEPPGGGRNAVTPRLLRHYNFLAFTELEDASKATIFCAILGAWLGICSKLREDKEALKEKLVRATVSVYSTITSELLPTPANSHYTFNLRDLSKVFQGVLMVQPHHMTSLPSLLRLWYHECCRVFQDRLVSSEDRSWFNERMKERFKEFGVEAGEILNKDTLFYGDFMVPNQEDKQYVEVEDHEKLSQILDEYLDDYNQINTAKMDLVLFKDAMKHVCRISRIIRQPLGNALLLGVGGSGRQSLTRLASHMAEYDCFQIELSKNYGIAEWREDVKNVLLKAGLENKPVVFLFSDTQIKSESFLEDINNVLSSGDVPNIYAPDEQDKILDAMKPVVQDAGQQATKANLFTAYTKRVRASIHMVICMSPIGEVFRSRLRKFPSLVNCCTIDWFSEWPDEALKSVAKTYLQDLPELSSLDSIDGLVQVCVDIHQSVVDKSRQYMVELNRQNHVTPTSYLELLGLFQKLVTSQKTELSNGRNRAKTGLDKLLSTAEIVDRVRRDLDKMAVKDEQRLERAHQLIRGLAGEKARWRDTMQRFDTQLENVIGDVLLSSAVIAYLGPFTGNFRDSLVQLWKSKLTREHIAYSPPANLINTLSDPVRIRQWQLAGLPRDNLSVENGVIVQFSRRWPLFIDPQGQANRWVKSLEKSIDVVKLTDRDFLRSLENAVRFGKPCLLENVGEELDPALDPILTRQTFKQAGSMVIKLGDNVIPYHDDFKLYITTKLPNPRYTPELATKVTVLNFTLSPRGLEDQLLGFVVAEERPDLEDAKNALIVSNARMKQELKEIEDKILFKLSNSKGNPVDDIEMIDVLQASKAKSQEIQSKVAVAEKTKQDIDSTRSLYIPVSIRTRILFFCVNDLSNIDPMYQYSLEWFLTIFLSSIAEAEKSEDLSERICNINDYFTFSLYSNVCRSLFEKHKLLFSFLLSIRILMNEDKIDLEEWRFLISGSAVVPKKLTNPAPDWISERCWKEVLSIQSLPRFATFAEEFTGLKERFKSIFHSINPHREQLPNHWSELDSFQKLLVLRCLRPDKLAEAMRNFVSENIGLRFTEPQTSDLAVAFKDSSPVSPLIFVLSQGTDPAADLYKFTDEMKFTKKLSVISLGQGQGPIAEKMMKEGMERGKWIFFQNCHLAPSWMPTLERLVEQIDRDKVHRDFRLWLSSMPSAKFPVPILQNGCKMTIEPPRGIKANLLKSYTGMSDEFLNLCTKKNEFRRLLFSLCLFHGVTLERKKFGALGFNIPYEFTDGDLKISISQLQIFLDEFSHIPFKALNYTIGELNYGGRVSDDKDRRCLIGMIEDFYNPQVLSDNHKFDKAGIYHQMKSGAELSSYLRYIENLPTNDTPGMFGLHENANIAFAQRETVQLLDGILLTQSKISAGGENSRKTMIEEMSRNILSKIPSPFPLETVMERYPVMYMESMNTVLVQEVIRFNRLIETIIQTLKDLLKALQGLVVMSQQLEEMSVSLYNNSVPKIWAGKAYPSLKPLAAWVDDLVERVKFIDGWIHNGIPTVFWFSGFFFPQAFMTGILQNFSRRSKTSIDAISFSFQFVREPYVELTRRPENGCFISGLYIEGARWCSTTHELTESRPKELFTGMPVIHLLPTANRTPPDTGVYNCPLYKTLARRGVLSTAGHSTNFVVSIELPTSMPQSHWIKRGVAMLCSLSY